MILALELSWFTTIPGMLITGGVLLLIIALIIFIATSNKKEKPNQKVAAVQEKAAAEAAQMVAQPVPTEGASPEVVVQPVVTPTVQEMPTVIPMQVNTEPSVFTNPIPTPGETMNVQNEPTPVVTAPTQVESVPVMETFNTFQPQGTSGAFDLPQATPMQTATETVKETPMPVGPVSQDTIIMPEVKIVEPTPVVSQPKNVSVVNQEPILSTPVVEPTPVPIYGGVSPVIPNIEINPQPERPIYGGANPLENTQTVPVVAPSSPLQEEEPKVVVPHEASNVINANPTVPNPMEQPNLSNVTPSFEPPVQNQVEVGTFQTPVAPVVSSPAPTAESKAVVTPQPVETLSSPQVAPANTVKTPQPESLF